MPKRRYLLRGLLKSLEKMRLKGL